MLSLRAQNDKVVGGTDPTTSPCQGIEQDSGTGLRAQLTPSGELSESTRLSLVTLSPPADVVTPVP